MPIRKHDFTNEIITILDRNTNGQGEEIIKSSEIIQYLNIKTKAANRGSKSRAGFANHYAIYVLIEDYLNGNFDKNGAYSDYEGAKFSDLLRRQREMLMQEFLRSPALQFLNNIMLSKEYIGDGRQKS